MVITEKDIQELSIRTMLDVKRIREIFKHCNLLGDIFNLNLGAKDKILENIIKNIIFIEIINIRKER